MLAPSDPPLGDSSQLSVRPVLDRVVYILSLRLGARDKQVRIVFTPIITLWNPFNIALDIDGAVVFPWMDEPFNMEWKFTQKNSSGASVSTFTGGCGMAGLMGRQFETAHHGRSINPYFLCKMTADGTASLSKPIHFEPGEIRVFTPVSDVPLEFNRKASDAQRSVLMWPVDSIDRLHVKGGIAVPVKGGVDGGGFDHVMNPAESVQADFFEAATDARYHYFVTLEDSSRIANPADNVRGKAVTTVQMLQFHSETNRLRSPVSTYYELLNGTAPPFGVVETYHRVASQSTSGQNVADLVYTTNPRQIDINHLLSAGTFTVAPHYQSTLRAVSSIDGAIQTSTDGRNAFWGATNGSGGSTHLPFFGIPREPMLSLAAFQNADLASSTFSPANQFANSWASPYLGANRAGQRYFNLIPTGTSLYDTSYLANEALWDGYFFSGAAPRLAPSSASSVSNAWDSDIASANSPLDKVVKDFVADPYQNPLANSRMRLYRGGLGDQGLTDLMLAPDGCARIAAHLMVDGAFNINSTDENAWVATLAGLRGADFDVTGGKPPGASATAFPRFRNPTGTSGDDWNGFRALDDAQIRTLAKNIVSEVKKRGPFLSLAEFVNRRVESGELGYRGAIQAAIDATEINAGALQQKFDPRYYPPEARRQIEPYTGVGTPGFLTQADVLQSLAPVITPRSDTFTIRSYGEAKNKTGQVVATAMCEAVVQRVPDFVDPGAPADSAIADLNSVNLKFGRRFDVVSFRIVPSTELK